MSPEKIDAIVEDALDIMGAIGRELLRCANDFDHKEATPADVEMLRQLGEAYVRAGQVVIMIAPGVQSDEE